MVIDGQFTDMDCGKMQLLSTYLKAAGLHLLAHSIYEGAWSCSLPIAQLTLKDNCTASGNLPLCF